MPVIGVGGGIASGKTTVCKFFETWGAHRIDADAVGKNVVEKDSALLKKLIAAFGRDILHENGTLDRRRLGRVVFQDPDARKKLNEIVHPALLSELTHRVQEHLRKDPKAAVVIDAALLLEWDLPSLLDTLVVVEAHEEKRLERLVQGAGLTSEEALDRIQAQAHFKEKRATADFVISNNSTLQTLEQEAKAVWGKIMGTQRPKAKIPD